MKKNTASKRTSANHPPRTTEPEALRVPPKVSAKPDDNEVVYAMASAREHMDRVLSEALTSTADAYGKDAAERSRVEAIIYEAFGDACREMHLAQQCARRDAVSPPGVSQTFDAHADDLTHQLNELDVALFEIESIAESQAVSRHACLAQRAAASLRGTAASLRSEAVMSRGAKPEATAPAPADSPSPADDGPAETIKNLCVALTGNAELLREDVDDMHVAFAGLMNGSIDDDEAKEAMREGFEKIRELIADMRLSARAAGEEAA